MRKLDRTFQKIYHNLEETHFWFVARRNLLVSMVERDLMGRDAKILDIGCSAGSLIVDLQQCGYSDVLGIDVSSTAIEAARERGLNCVTRMDASKLDLPDNSYDCLIGSDVLEHIEDDGAALYEWKRVLVPGGLLYLFVPAFEILWSAHDISNHHHRRYTRRGLIALLNGHGFEVERSAYWNASLLLPVAASRLWKKQLRLVRLTAAARR